MLNAGVVGCLPSPSAGVEDTGPLEPADPLGEGNGDIPPPLIGIEGVVGML